MCVGKRVQGGYFVTAPASRIVSGPVLSGVSQRTAGLDAEFVGTAE